MTFLKSINSPIPVAKFKNPEAFFNRAISSAMICLICGLWIFNTTLLPSPKTASWTCAIDAHPTGIWLIF